MFHHFSWRRIGMVFVAAALTLSSARGEEAETPTEDPAALDVNGALIDTMVDFAKFWTMRGDWWEGAMRGASARSQHSLQGQTAPEFELATLSGEQVKLSQFRGKKVVVLDFWATWCGPCRRGLPGVAQLSKKLEKEDVAVYALNLGDSKEDIQKFLDEEKLDLSVLVDSESVSAAAYQVNAIPCTLVIDREGIVQITHIGYSPNLAGDLEHEVLGLLGKPIAETADASQQAAE